MKFFVELFMLLSWMTGATALGLSVSDVEGVYDVRVICEDRSNPNCDELNRNSKLTIIRAHDIVAASIGYPEQSLSRYIFHSHESDLKDGQFYGTPTLKNVSSSANFSEILIDFISQENKFLVKGIIRDARFSKDIQFFGHQVLPGPSTSSKEALGETYDNPEKAEGRFIAKGVSRQWLVAVRQTLENIGKPDYLVEITDLGSPDGKEFASGDRIYLKSIPSSQKGTLELLAPLTQPGCFLKWVLWVEPEQLLRATNLKGFYFSSNGVYSELSFRRM